jgi:hypothetical protein
MSTSTVPTMFTTAERGYLVSRFPSTIVNTIGFIVSIVIISSGS